MIHSNEFIFENCEFIGSSGKYGATTINGTRGKLILKNTTFTSFGEEFGRWPDGVQSSN